LWQYLPRARAIPIAATDDEHLNLVPAPCTRDTDPGAVGAEGSHPTCPVHARYRSGPSFRTIPGSDLPRARAIPFQRWQ